MKRILLILCLVFPITLHADEEADLYVSSNLIATLYHELGHALIDQMGLPVLGQEEDAADVLSILLVDALFEEEAAVSVALNTAFGFYESAQDEDVVFWDVHGPDLQRYYTTLCLFYGANPDEREDVVLDLGLPEERMITCEEEFELASDSWGPILDELEVASPGETPLIIGDGVDYAFAQSVLADEIALLNEGFQLPEALEVHLAPCGEANAFYDPPDATITLCTEYVDYLRGQAAK